MERSRDSLEGLDPKRLITLKGRGLGLDILGAWL